MFQSHKNINHPIRIYSWLLETFSNCSTPQKLNTSHQVLNTCLNPVVNRRPQLSENYQSYILAPKSKQASKILQMRPRQHTPTQTIKNTTHCTTIIPTHSKPNNNKQIQHDSNFTTVTEPTTNQTTSLVVTSFNNKSKFE